MVVNMEYLFKIQRKIVPEVIELAETRYSILHKIYNEGPIGRRAIAEDLELSERLVRNQLEFLTDRKLIKVSRAGAELTTSGEEFLAELERYIKEIKGFYNLERKLKKIIKLPEVIIVPCNLEYSSVLKELGRTAARYLLDLLQPRDVLAITGGYTMARVAEMVPDQPDRKFDITVVPGRGGLGEEVEIQANTIASTIAKKLGGKYCLLQVPDNLREENIAAIRKEPSIQRTFDILRQANILIHGVGQAEVMAERRGRTLEEISDLKDKGAIGEAFGFYFDARGEIVHSTPSVGLGLEDLDRIDKVIAVAGGENKARAIPAVISPEYQDVLITDENTARRIISLHGQGD